MSDKIGITFHGAARTVTGSRHLLEAAGHRILLDCGLFQGKRSESRDRNRNLPFIGEESRWAALAAEMGANPGNWVHDRENGVGEPATEFACARKIAYRRSQEGRDALPEAFYAAVFETGEIDDALAAALDARRAEKRKAGHVDAAPDDPDAGART